MVVGPDFASSSPSLCLSRESVVGQPDSDTDVGAMVTAAGRTPDDGQPSPVFHRAAMMLVPSGSNSNGTAVNVAARATSPSRRLRHTHTHTLPVLIVSPHEKGRRLRWM